MSDILIRGIEMPRDGSCFQIVIDDDGNVYPTVEKCIIKIGSIATAIPVPPHGRLKDYDRVMEQYSKWFRNTENREYENMFYMLQNELRGAPTIIPAEEGK